MYNLSNTLEDILTRYTCTGIFFLQENFRTLVQLTEKAREQYREMIVQIEKEIAEHPPRVSVPGVPHIFAHMGHSRTPSGCSVISFTSSILSEPISENYPHSEPETDNRGYEIEKDDDDEDDGNDDEEGNDDAYEADDESGFENRKKKKNKEKLKNFIEEKVKSGDPNTEYIIVNSGDNLGGTGLNSPPRRPGILKNSAERLRNMETVNGNSGSLKIALGNGDNNSSQDLELTPRNRSAESANLGQAEANDVVDDDDDDGNTTDKDLEFQTCEEDSDCDPDMAKENEDQVHALPQFIDSVHTFDLTEVLSQHSTKTAENGEDVLSTHSSKTTHSSRTLEGSVLTGDRVHDVKNKENSVMVLKGKAKVDKENRTLSWVKETQSIHFNEKIEPGRDLEENGVEVNGVSRECLDAVA